MRVESKGVRLRPTARVARLSTYLDRGTGASRAARAGASAARARACWIRASREYGVVIALVTGMTMSLRVPLVALLVAPALVMFGCSVGGDADGAAESHAAVGTASVTWGVVLGHVVDRASGGPVNLADAADPIACDLHTLGARWVRLEVNRGEDGASYGPFAARARARGVKVMLLRQPDAYRCAVADDACVDAWAGAYAAEVGPLLDVTHADALEIGNEPNGEYPIAAGAFARLVERTWRDAKPSHRGVTFVSGGILNAYPDAEPFTQAFIDALSPAASAPFDAFGIHPYNPYDVSAGGEAWLRSVRDGLTSITSRLASKFGAAPPLWATEVGFASKRASTNVVGSEAAQATTFDLADRALSGLVERAFWYDYRDDEPGPGTQGFTFGLRASSSEGYRAKPLYGVVASRLGGAGESARCYDAPSPAPSNATSGGGDTGGGSAATGAPSCGLLAGQRGWGDPLCDNGNGICEGSGEATSDCQRCCDTTTVHCGSLQRVFGWGSRAACDDGNGACGGRGHVTADCSGGCCEN